MRQIIIVFFTISMFFSCVSETEHDKTLDENTALKSELEEIKLGAPNLLRDGKKFFDNKDFVTTQVLSQIS